MDQDTSARNSEEEALVQQKLLEGVVSRASFVCFIWGIAVLVWGVASLEIFRVVQKDLTLIENLVPRFFFNTIPAFMFGFWYRKYSVNPNIKAYSTAISLPFLLASAALVNAWPLLWNGHYELYLYLHAANLITISTALALTSGTPRVIILQAIGFFSLFWLPIIVMLARDQQNAILINLILNDYGLVLAVFIPGLYAVHKLRYKLAIADKRVKELTRSFLGSPLTQAIYEDGVDGLANFIRNGIMLAVDMRGYTNFVHNVDSKVVKAFMKKYHTIVSQAVGNNSGYLHKSSGDGHMISFGVMDANVDLTDIPGYDDEIKRSDGAKKAVYFLNSIKTFVHMLLEFEKLKSEFKVNVPLLIGAGIAFGPVEVVLRGDKRFRQELDIDGETIVRAVRLESYSKFLNINVDQDSSFLLISPELASEVLGVPGIHEWKTVGEGQIRDYPWIEKIYFRQWKHNRKRASFESAA